MEYNKRGSLYRPRELTTVTCICKVAKSIYQHNQKHYIDLELSPDTLNRVEELHTSSESFLLKENKMIPLQGNKLKTKIPFRYKKVTCKMPGNKTVHELLQDDRVKVSLEYTGVWTVGEYCGVSWKISSIQEM
jgi:hypothetical protein